MSYNPATQAKQAIADESEKVVAKAIKGQRTADNAPFDVIRGRHGIEIKTVIGGKNDKITMHPESRERKLKFAEEHTLEMHTVVVDRRAGTTYYYKAGVGSYRFGSAGNMRKVSLKELEKIIK